MMKQEARQIPVTIVVMKVNGVAVEKIQIDPTRRGERMNDPTAEYLMAKSRLHQLNAIKLMEEQESEKALLELKSMAIFLALRNSKKEDNAPDTNTTSNTSV
jgi:hypothetical protein